MQWFERDTTRKIHQKSVQRNLDEKRDTLLGGLPDAFVSNLPKTNNSSDQLMLDLQELNSTEEIVDGIKPFEVWLKNAAYQVSVFPDDQQFFKGLADKVTAGEAYSHVPETEIGNDGGDEPKPSNGPAATGRSSGPIVQLTAWQMLGLFAFVVLVGIGAFFVNYILGFILFALAMAIGTFGVLNSQAEVHIPELGKFGSAAGAAFGTLVIALSVYTPPTDNGINITGTVYLDEAKEKIANAGKVELVGMEHRDSPAEIKATPPGFFEINNIKDVVGQKLKFKVTIRDPVNHSGTVEIEIPENGKVDLVIVPPSVVYKDISEFVIEPVVAELENANTVTQFGDGNSVAVKFNVEDGDYELSTSRRTLYFDIADVAIAGESYKFKFKFFGADDEFFNVAPNSEVKIRGTIIFPINKDEEEARVLVEFRQCRMQPQT